MPVWHTICVGCERHAASLVAPYWGVRLEGKQKIGNPGVNWDAQSM